MSDAIRSIWRFSFLAIAAAAFAATGCSAAPDRAPAPGGETRSLDGRVVGISDGDTLTLLVDRERVRVRLARIDAPELDQPYGKRAKAALSALALRKRARVEVIDIDRYGRTVGEVFVDGIDVNREMVREGHAWAYTKYSNSTEIIELESGARAAAKGLWALPENQREPPWIWRHPPRAARPKPAPLACGTRSDCREMAACEEARFYLERCRVHSLDGDGDGDGVPCESLCSMARYAPPRRPQSGPADLLNDLPARLLSCARASPREAPHDDRSPSPKSRVALEARPACDTSRGSLGFDLVCG